MSGRNGSANNAGDVPQPGEVYAPEAPARPILQTLARRWYFVLASLVLGAGGSALYIWKAPRIYEATATIEVSRPPRIIESKELLEESGEFLQKQCAMIQSGPILAGALENTPGLDRLGTFTEAAESAVAYLRDHLDAVVGRAGLIQVSCESPYPKDAEQVVGAVVDAYSKRANEQKKGVVREVLALLQRELVTWDGRRKQKQAAVFEFQQSQLFPFRSKHPELSFRGEKGSMAVARLLSLNEALTTAAIETIKAESNYKHMQAMAKDPNQVKQLVDAQRARGGSIYVETEDARLEGERNSLEVQLRMLREDRKGQHPAIQRLEKRIAEINAKLRDRNQKFANAQVAIAKQEYETAKTKEATLRQQEAGQRKKVTELNQRAVELAKLESELAGLQSEYEETRGFVKVLENRINEINIAEDTGSISVTIVEPAHTPEEPKSPNVFRAAGIGVIAGLVLGIALALLRDRLDYRLRTTDEVEYLLGAPVIGAIAEMPGKRREVVARAQKVLQAPRSPFAEAYRAVRTAVYFSRRGGPCKTVLVTSPDRGEGKSTLVSNLGIAMAQAGHRTLILDADCREPVQHAFFELPSQRGLSSVLLDGTPLQEAICPTHVPRLDLLPCGPRPDRPSEMLNGEGFRDLIARLREEYDYVLLDSPPVTRVTDAQILGAVTDLTVLTLLYNESTSRATESARLNLIGVGARILGAVVNSVPLRRRRYGLYAGYAYGYGNEDRERSTESEGKDAALAPSAAVSAEEGR